MKYAEPLSPDLLTKAELMRTVQDLTGAVNAAADSSRPMSVRDAARRTALDCRARLDRDNAVRERLPEPSAVRVAEMGPCGCRPRHATPAEQQALSAQIKDLRRDVEVIQQQAAALLARFTPAGQH